MNVFFPIVQTVVLGHDSELVVFTVNTRYRVHTPDLSAYGLEVAVGERYCGSPVSCAGSENAVLEESELVMTQGADEQHLRAGDTQQMTGVSVSVQEVSATVGTMLNCDPPPGWHRYGGFGAGP